MRPDANQPSSRRKTRLLVTFLLAFAVVLSMWAFDFVVALDPVWGSTGIGFHLFVGAAASGAALLVLLGLDTGQGDQRLRHDSGSLLLTFSLLWGYLFWAQFLTIWYANLPSETAFVLRRVASPWNREAIVVVLLSLVVPFLLMLRPGNKSSRRWLRIAAAAQFLGVGLERHLLVVPSLSAASTWPLPVVDVLISLGLGGAFLLAACRSWQRLSLAAPEAGLVSGEQRAG
jgi:Ni/Fe-hydrogenase subunit HybB-like protein